MKHFRNLFNSFKIWKTGQVLKNHESRQNVDADNVNCKM